MGLTGCKQLYIGLTCFLFLICWLFGCGLSEGPSPRAVIHLNMQGEGTYAEADLSEASSVDTPEDAPELSSTVTAEDAPEAELSSTDTPEDAPEGEASAADTPEDVPEAEVSEGPIRLTLSEAIKYALRGNRHIQVASYNPPQAVQTLRSAKAVYDPSLFSLWTLSRTERPIESQLDTGSVLDEIFTEDQWLLQTGLRKHLLTGGEISVFQELNYLESNSDLIFPNPQYGSKMKAELTQPILRGILDLANQSAIEIAKRGVDISNQEFRQLVTEVVAETVKTYWQLVSDREFMRIAKETLDMANEVLRREEVRLRKGISKQLDVSRARMAVSTREVTFLEYEKQMRVTSERLKSLLNLSAAIPDSDAEVIPLDDPFVEMIELEQEAEVAKAMEKRPEIIRALKTVEVNRLQRDIADHNRLPRLDAKMSYTLNGLGNDSYKAMEMGLTEEKNSWMMGLEFELPIGGRQADAEYRKRMLGYNQSLVELRRVTEQITHEVAQAIYEVHLAEKEIGISRKAKLAAESVVISEHARFELALMGNEALLQVQDLFASAARDHIRALIHYNNSLTLLRHVRGTLLDDLNIWISEQETQLILRDEAFLPTDGNFRNPVR